MMNTNRLEAFSDGVMAIAITLPVLEISVPEAGPALAPALAFLPFPTAVLAKDFSRGTDEAIAAVFYGGTLVPWLALVLHGSEHSAVS